MLQQRNDVEDAAIVPILLWTKAWLASVSPELAGGLAWMRCKLEEDQEDAAIPVAVLTQ